MPSNPPDIWSIFSALGTFASGLGTVLLVWLAVRGLNQWRAQLQGTSKYSTVVFCHSGINVLPYMPRIRLA